MIERHRKIVSESDTPLRLQAFVREHFKSQLLSGKAVKKAIKTGEIRLNDQKSFTGVWLNAGDVVTLLDLEFNPPKPYELELECLFEDAHLAIIVKPAGINVSGNRFRTIQNALVHNFEKSKLDDALAWCRPVHRLDNQTQGLLIVARTKSALYALQDLFVNGEIQKTYHAVVMGKTPEKGSIRSDVDNKKAVSHFTRMDCCRCSKTDHLSLLELRPETGRTHQLRIHCASIGSPILGDKLYSPSDKVFKNKGLFLAATGLKFVHPFSKETLDITIPIPSKFKTRMERENRMWKRRLNQ